MLIDGVVDVHVHSLPSLLPRHANDADTVAASEQVGVALSVLKAHEGSTAERAVLAGSAAIGGIVLNSPVGGANPDAVEVAARLGGRVVWMPTISAPAHHAAKGEQELDVHRGIDFRRVEILEHGALMSEWHEVLEVVAAHDQVLGSGHLRCHEALVLFRAAREHGVDRLLLNHPVMPFIDYRQEDAKALMDLGAHLELSILADIMVQGRAPTSIDLAEQYPAELLVLGGDLGHRDHPTLSDALPGWLGGLAARVGDTVTESIVATNGRRLVVR